MKTQVETVSEIKRKISVEVPVEKIRESLDKVYREIGKKAKIKGFREGKVPRNILEQYYKADAEKNTVEEVVKSTYPEVLKNENILPVSEPKIDFKEFKIDKPFSYTAEFEVKPEVKIEKYEGLSLEKLIKEIDDEEVENVLKSTQQQMTQLEPAKEGEAVRKDIVAFVDFKGTADGQSFKGGEAENFAMDIGSGNLLPVFEEKVIGMKAGESKKIEFEYPKDYFNKDIAGKKGEFNVKVRELKVKKVPELNDDFAKDLGSFKTINDVKVDIKKRLEATAENEAKSEMANQAIELLVKKNKFDVPEGMVMSELRFMFEGFARQLAAQGKKFEESGMTAEQFIQKFKPSAEDRVRGFLILDSIAGSVGTTVEDTDVEARLNAVAAQAGKPPETIREHYEKNNLMSGLKTQIIHEKTLDFIILKAKIKTKKVKKEKTTPKKGSS